MTSNDSDEEYPWRPLSHEERTRHEILFYMQGPMDGFLPGEQARELFLRSKLPLHILSQIWNLVDQPQDNVLDAAEFAAAMHLIRHKMRGVPVPKERLPQCLLPSGKRSEVRIPVINKRELRAYKKLFQVMDKDKKGHLKGELVRDVLHTSGLPTTKLAQIWNLSDLDRDGKLALDEFCIACHLTRYTKKGRIHFTGPINILGALPHRMLKTDLAAKRTKMAELEDRKKKLMDITAKKKSEAGRESERAKIWRERLEILSQRHQALREDDVGVNEIILTLEKRKLDKVRDIVAAVESSSDRLDREQQQVRKETANIIMETEKVAQEVKHLQNEVNILRENRRRTSQLKDLDPFHQLFEDQKEETLTGIPVTKKEYDIHIPFKTDPFNPRKLDSPPLSGEELFNCSISDSNSEIEEIFNRKHSTPNNLDPWSSSVINTELQDLTLGFEDSFVNTWGQCGVEQHDRNENVITEPVAASPINDFDFKFTPEDDEPVFRTISVTKEEDDLWSSLPDTVLATEHDALKHLQAKWAATSIRLTELDNQLQRSNENTQKQGSQPSDVTTATVKRAPQVSPLEGAVTFQQRPECVPQPALNVTRPDLLEIITETHSIAPQSRINNSLTVSEVFENNRQINGVIGTKSTKQDLRLDNSIIPEESTQSVDIFESESVEETRDLLLEQCLRESTEHIVRESLSVKRESKDNQLGTDLTADTGTTSDHYTNPPVTNVIVHTHNKSHDLPADVKVIVENHDKKPANSEIVNGLEVSHGSPSLSFSSHDTSHDWPESLSPPSSSHSTPCLVLRHTKSLNKSTETSRESTPLPSSSPSPQPPPRSRSLKRRSFTPTETSRESQSSVQGLVGSCRKHLEFDTPESVDPTQNLCSKGVIDKSEIHGLQKVILREKPNRESSDIHHVGKLTDESSVPPKPPPRLKKYKRLSRASQYQSVDVCTPRSYKPVNRSQSLPPEPSAYENCAFTATENKIDLNNTPKTDLLSEIQSALLEHSDENISVIQIAGATGETEQFSSKHDHDLDVVIPSNPENISAESLSSQSTENLYVNVVQIGDQLDEVKETDREDDMDDFGRKNELEKLRSQFFGKKSSRIEEHVEGDGVSMTTTSTVISLSSDHANEQPSVSSTLLEIGVGGQVVSDQSANTLYELIKKQKDTQPGGATTTKMTKIILDLDEHQTQREFDATVVPAPMVPAPVVPTPVVPAPHAEPTTSRIVLDLDKFSNKTGVYPISVNNNNDGTKEKSSAVEMPVHKSKILLDLDEIQIIPGSVTTTKGEVKVASVTGDLLIDTSIPDSGRNDENEMNMLMTPTSPLSPSDMWGKAEESDMSDGEDNFTATFVPGAEVPPEWPFAGSHEDENENEDSGIVLTSYQQKTVSPNLINFNGANGAKVEDQGQRSKFDNPGQSTSCSQDSFDLLSSLTDSSDWDKQKVDTAGDMTSLEFSTHNVAVEESNSDLLAGIPAPAAFSVGDSIMTSDLNDSGLLAADKVRISTQPPKQLSSTVIREMDRDSRGQPSAQDLISEFYSSGAAMKSPAVLAGDDQSSAIIVRLDTSATDTSSSRLQDATDVSASRENLHLDLNRRTSRSPEPHLLDPEYPDDDMDPLTGLRKTAPLSPIDKAKMFVEGTELTYKVKKKEDVDDPTLPLSPEQVALSIELEQERHEIMDAVRVRKKRMDSWVGDSIEIDSNRQKTDSERQYEERKKKLDMEKRGESFSDQFEDSLTPFERTMKEENVRSLFHMTSDIDSRSIKDQLHTKGPWEAKSSDVDIADIKLYKSDKLQQAPNSSTKVNCEVKVSTVVTEAHDNKNEKESAIDREIRSAQKREAELQAEKELRSQEQQPPPSHGSQSDDIMTIHKVPEPITVVTEDDVTKVNDVDVPPLPTSPIPLYKDLPDESHETDEVYTKTESFMDREIREQREREETLRHDSELTQINKEAEQSEFERREKEHEKVQAHESIVDREIRIQQERERELLQLRKSVSVDFTQHEDVSPRPASPVQPVVMATSPEPVEPVHVESAVSYETAIGSKVHDGESIIARELREQRDREDELRSRYEEMGLHTLLDNRDPPDTPYNAPEPQQPNISKLPAQAKATMKMSHQPRGMSRSISEPVHIASQLDPSRPASNHVHMQTSSSQHVIANQTIHEEPHRVHPLVEPDGPDEPDVSYQFAPQNETPIEREMRLAREREEELRQSRGFKINHDPTAIVEIKEVTSPAPKPHVIYKKGDEGDGKIMQQFASSRLQVEIEKEKRRELDLRSQGMISTLSSERDKGQVKYVDVIPKESPDSKRMPNWRVQNAIARTVSPAHSVDSIDSPSPQPPTENNGTAANHQVELEGAKQEPAIVRRYSSHTQQLQLHETDKYKMRPSPTIAETRIEVELREMKDREEELRNLRRSFSAMASPSLGGRAEDPNNGYPEDGMPFHDLQSPQGDQSVKSGRRKSALAEEWERKFGVNN